jgi:NAD(P)-dependent dehydrogenase (short-subunit alcohol dehydrogenase family)
VTGRFDVTGQVVIVTGAAGLLGQEYGRALAGAGACVVLADIDRPGVEALAAELTRAGGRALGLGVDVADEASVRHLVASTLDAYGRLDGLVNNAALDPKVDAGQAERLGLRFEDYPLDLWNQALAVNLTGTFLCCREAGRAMVAGGRGSIVNIASTYGLVGPDQRLYASDDPQAPPVFKPPAYSATKSAVIGLTHYLAAYWGPAGLRVNTLTPGGVRNRQPAAFVRRYSDRTPLGRMAERDEYCGALLFLLSDASSYMTGSNVVVDGGWTAW